MTYSECYDYIYIKRSNSLKQKVYLQDKKLKVGGIIMINKQLLNSLNANGNYYYESEGNYITRVHILYNNSNKVKVPSKKHKGDYNICEIAFAHLYEEDDELYWFKIANHSSVLIGNKCIPDIYENLLKSPSLLITDGKGREMEAKKILDTEIPQIVNYINNLNKIKMTLDDVDYDPKR